MRPGTIFGTVRIGLLWAVLFIAFSAWALGGRSDQRTVAVVLALACVPAVAGVLVLSILAARASHGRTRAGWTALAFGAFMIE